MNYLVNIISAQPLTLHFSLHNPAQAGGATLVPRMLEPLGAFVSVVVRGSEGNEVCRTHPPKFTPKLKPSQASSYMELEPGYSYGVVLVVEDCELRPGQLRGRGLVHEPRLSRPRRQRHRRADPRQNAALAGALSKRS